MISIIICSKNIKLFSDLSENISKTIGCEFEIIRIKNYDNKFSIFSAYNKGFNDSTGKFIVFVHEDVIFHTKNWGNILFDLFENDSKIGLIGIAGSKIKTKNISGWWDSPEESWVMNLIQHDNGKVKNLNIGFQGKNYEEVAVIDGVFMAIRINSFINYFDESLNGFHCYDHNLSINSIISGYKNIVTNQILVEHFSIGNQNECWYANSYIFHKKYSRYLPIKIGSFKYYNLDGIENINIEKVLNNMIRYNMVYKTFVVWFIYLLQNPFNLFHLKYFLKLGKKHLFKL
jgi:hypothetical protein